MTTMPLPATLRRLTSEPPSLRPFRRSLSIGALACLALLPFSPSPAQAQEPSGAVGGRVFNAATQRYVNNARLTVQGTTRQTFTGEDGSYRLSGLLLNATPPALEIQLPCEISS